MMTYKAAVRLAERDLEANGQSMQLAKLFMHSLASEQDINLYLDYEQEMDDTLNKRFTEGMQRLLRHEPMQYILGYEWFYGYAFDVNPQVLIPRPETEELVAQVLMKVDDMLERQSSITLADVGCGSGAIGIALKLEEPRLKVLASDISEEALQMAKQNAKKLDADVTFYYGSMLEPFISSKCKLDVIVCNPPYIPQNESLDATVRDFEPHVALFGGNDGLYFYKLVLDHCQSVLQPHGFMAFEIGYDQKDALLAEVHERFPQAYAEVLQDINKKDRMLIVDFYQPANV